MPTSSDHDSGPSNNSGSHNQKQAPKQPTAAVHIPKKERKNGAAKDSNAHSGHVKQSSRMVDSGKPSPTPGQSPRLVAPDAKPNPATANGSSITSPLLDALSSNAFTTSAAQNTNEWARNVPAFSTSPGNLISLSDSPPTQPSSYQDERSTLAGWNNRERGTTNGQLSSVSPPPARRRPLSFQMDGQHVLEDQPSQRAPYTYRRSSMYSQHSARYGPTPPLPHFPQAHFYGTPDPSFGLPAQASGLPAGSRSYFCSFDSLSATMVGTSGQNVVLSGYEGGLDIYSIGSNGLSRITSIDGLRGGVFYAKILPWTVADEEKLEAPLIALVIHGPVLDTMDASNDGKAAQSAQQSSSLPKREQSPAERNQPPCDEANSASITHYQTTVEIFSLAKKRHITTILSAPKVPLIAPITSSLFSPPPPTGTLSLFADEGHVVVASAATGETWIFDQDISRRDTPTAFRCTGKIWVSIQRTSLRDSASSPEYEDGDGFLGEPKGYLQQLGFPLISIKGRWLAYSPCTASAQASLKATVYESASGTRVPGLNSFAPPQLPPVTCVVDMPNKDGLYNDIVRMGTQGVIKGAGWIGDHGKQAWNSYWNKSPPSSNAAGTSGWHNASPPTYSNAFPPTHGEFIPRTTSNAESHLISIIDMDKLGTTRNSASIGSPHPFATFESPLGCSFLSFAPNGLLLFAASSKGDVQFIWDIMRTQFTKSSILQTRQATTAQGLHVRQVARFTRLTVARIVNVVWALPSGEKLAVVTERNTVHFLDLPASAFEWPPPRRRAEANQPLSPAAMDVSDMPKAAATIATNAVSAAWSFAQPLISRPRGLSGPGRSGISAASVTAQAGYGTKVLAAGISKSFGAASGTIEHFRKSGENILRLPQSTALLTNGGIQWMCGQHRDSLCVIAEGVVKLYRIKQKKSKGGSDRTHASVGGRSNDFKLPLIPEYKVAPMVMSALRLEDEFDFEEKDPEGPQWDLLERPAVKAGNFFETGSSIPQAEIESNAPYQPFHTDRRVTLHVYQTEIDSKAPSVSVLDVGPVRRADPNLGYSSIRSEPDGVPWVFGRPIITKKLDVSPVDDEDGSQDLGVRGDHIALPLSAMERVRVEIPEAEEDVEQIVITTRRRRGGQHVDMPEVDQEGFFEDDCEVLDFASQRV